MRAIVLIVSCVLVLLAGTAMPRGAAAEGAASLKDFFGRFVGQGIAKNRDNLYFGVALRDIDTEIAPHGDGGFIVKWSTLVRDGETARKIDNALTFVPSGKANIFKAADNGDPLSIGHYAWARLDGRAMTVNVFEIGDVGQGRWQVYERRLTGDGIELTFRRLDATGALRIVSGKLKRQN